ncbi:kinase-like domain-containing protein [Suillus tomentosus]|nr:kinase-like domain-containing protein [Suillus tomentosus]
MSTIQAAVKEIVLRGDTDTLTIIKRLSGEIKIWLKLEHNNIVPLWGVADGFGYLPALVSPWLKMHAKVSLAQGHSSRASVLYVQRFVIDARVNSQIEAVHSRSITHGDSSGNEVLVDKDGQASLTDFGLSALVPERRSQASVPTKCGGTTPYMAPERLAVDDEDDESTPVFSPKSNVDTISGIK